MARPRNNGGFTISQLKSMLESRQSQLDELERERAKVVKQLAAVDEKIRTLGGGGGGRGSSGGMSLTASGRARNPQSLVGTLEEIMKKNGGPMGVGDIVEAVQASGYQSNSANFRAIVNQTLIKERKRFENTGRGIYGLKK